jgi:hypothetical protein
MSKQDFANCETAYDCRQQLPTLAAWMSDDALKALRLWKGRRLEADHMYFDLLDPDRGAFVATSDDGPPTSGVYVCRDDVPEQFWAQLITWRQPVGARQGEAIDRTGREFGMGREQSAAGEAHPIPPT